MSAIKKAATTAISLDSLFEQRDNISETEKALQQNIEKKGYTVEPRDKAFKPLSLTQYNISGIDNSTSIFNKNITGVIDTILGFRGSIISFHSGYSLWSGEKKDDGKTALPAICQTVGTVDPLSNEVTCVSPYPVNAYYADVIYPTVRDFDTKENLGVKDTIKALGLMGSRGLSCEECILKGNNEYQVHEKTGEVKTERCSASSFLIFGIHEVLVSNSSALKGTSSSEWIDITELKNKQGEQIFTECQIVKIPLSSSVLTKSIKATKSTTPLRAETIPAGQLPVEGAVSTAPEDCDTFGSFIVNLMKSSQPKTNLPYYRYDSKIPNTDIERVYIPVVEVFQAKRTDKFNVGLAYVPLFRISPDYATGDDSNLSLSASLLIEAASVYSQTLADWKIQNNYEEQKTLPIRQLPSAASVTVSSTPAINGSANGSTSDTNGFNNLVPPVFR